MKLDKYEVKSMKLDKKLLILGFLVMAIETVAAQAQRTVMSLINALICRLITVLWGISAAVATIVIVIAGIKWIGSSEDLQEPVYQEHLHSNAAKYINIPMYIG
ncbi:MAG: hypothetical protein B6U86_04995 [Candidatus Altiarchaeales archaeon ex4484_43]|nr:MAG: hypothetical protein B6U86_04995 [Candidatus Altiarchaeales archaeon ex4484_43]